MNYPIHGGPLDGGERPREKLFPWLTTLLSVGFTYQGHFYLFNTVSEVWEHKGLYEPTEEEQ
jgi:hypothetical protein